MRLWRIGSALHPVCSGEGARLKGGRWNQPGTSAIYAATSYAAAVLEILVHGNIGRVPRGFRYVTIDIPDDARIDRVAPDAVAGWDAMPPRASCAFGEAWLRGREALVLLVPSVVTNGLDLKALVNPLHPDFARIVIGEEQPVQWDARLLPARAGR
ncbi:MAG: RES domain-containing protein [Acetobacteraceae bacterium]|jgi:RES domain-containing protein